MAEASRQQKIPIISLWYVALFVGLALAAGHCTAANETVRYSSNVNTPHLTATLTSEVSSVVPGEEVWIGLHQDIIENWHTYWRNPGDSGLATRIEWQSKPRYDISDIYWPTPTALPFGPLVNYGYEGEVLLPVRLKVPDDVRPGEILTLAAKASWLVCEEICIPENGHFTLNLPVSPAGTPKLDRKTGWAQDFDDTLAALPGPLPGEADYQLSRNSFRLNLMNMPLAFEASSYRFFPSEGGLLNHAAVQRLSQTTSTDSRNLSLTVGRLDDLADFKGQTITGVLTAETAEGEREAYRITARPGAPLLVAETAFEPDMTLLQALIGALIGGLLLNLMPCVFPVLSMKALHIARLAEETPQSIRINGLAYAGGVLASFAALAGTLILFKQIGMEIGWGFQLQNPVFVALLIYVFFALGLSLSGVFEIGAGIAGLGNNLTQKSGVTGAFFTGVLASIVATPCTAPLMGVALGYALTQPPFVALLIFLMLGLGLAFPFVLISFVPGLSRWLPRPGVWMQRFKQILAFPMYLSAVWLVWVLAKQSGADGVGAVLAGLVMLSFAIWLANSFRAASGFSARILPSVLFVASLMGAGYTALAIPRAPIAIDENPQIAQIPFTPQSLEQARASGKPVFVEMTAAWCITCAVNKRLALDTQQTEALFRRHDVIWIQGDWTNADPQITAFMERFGRTGVPFYVYYPPSSSSQNQPVFLPQILTPAIVKETIRSSIVDETLNEG